MLLLKLHFAATLYMLGVIVFVQINHYPLFAAVGREAFCDYERRHCDRTTFVVMPAMLIELFTAILLLLNDPTPPLWINFALLGGIWLSTFFIQVPLHTKLSQGFDEAVHRRLVQTNWARTLAWSVRSVELFFLLP